MKGMVELDWRVRNQVVQIRECQIFFAFFLPVTFFFFFIGQGLNVKVKKSLGIIFGQK